LLLQLLLLHLLLHHHHLLCEHLPFSFQTSVELQLTLKVHEQDNHKDKAHRCTCNFAIICSADADCSADAAAASLAEVVEEMLGPV
jgi:hypothetical protein